MIRTLDDLMQTLAAIPPYSAVTMDGSGGLGFASWRGNYEHLTITHGGTSVGTGRTMNTSYGFAFGETTGMCHIAPASTVGELLDVARQVVDGYMEGYKGGSFHMGAETPLWADPYGLCPGDRLAGVTYRAATLRLVRVPSQGLD